MRRLGMQFVVCAAVLAIASTAMAQGQGQGRGGRGGRGGFGGGGGFGGVNLSRIVGIEEVQKDLKITDEQKTKLTAIRDEARQAGGGGAGGAGGTGGFGNFQNLSEEERAKLLAEMAKRQEERDKKVEAVLDADQNKRAKELILQLRGNAALADPAIAKQLALTEDQVASVKTIQEESGKQMRELFQPGGGGDRAEARKKMDELRKNTNEEYMNVLTDEQKAKFAAMKGAKADFDESVLFRGFGGGGRGGQGGQGGRGGQGGQGGNGRRGGRGGNNSA